MKIQIDLDGELWAKFRTKVHDEGKFLSEVVPTVFEPALRWYLREPPLTERKPSEIVSDMVAEEDVKIKEQLGLPTEDLPIIDRITPPKAPPLPATTRRCELCDTPTERLFAFQRYRVCYKCWKEGLIETPEPTPPEAA